MTLAEQFMARFRGLSRAYGTYVMEGRGKSGKVSGKARTVHKTVSMEVWQSHLDGKVGLGIVPIDDDSKCSFGAIDIDVYEDLNLEALSKRVAEMDLPLIVARSKSGGAHLYAFFSEPIQARVARDRLMEWSVLLGHAGVEIFPKQYELMSKEDTGNWINMPYFGGNRTLRYGLMDGRKLSAEEFLETSEAMAMTEKGFLSVEIKVDDRFADGPPCLQHLATSGFPQGTRNRALFNMGIFCKKHFGDDWEIELKKMNESLMIPPLGAKEVENTIQSLRKKDYIYTCKEEPIASVCNRALCIKRKYGIGQNGGDAGVALNGLIKVNSEQPTWLVNVNGRQIRLDSTQDLIDQSRFISRCVQVLNELPNRVKRIDWDDQVRTLLKKTEHIEAPEDTGEEGQFKFLLQKFCLEQARARNMDEILIGLPYHEEGRIILRGPDLADFVQRHKCRIPSHTMWNTIRTDFDGQSVTFKLKGRRVRCWSIKMDTGEETEEIPPEERGVVDF